LEAPEMGGATIFPMIGLRVPPIKNGAIFWYNLNSNEKQYDQTLHSGCPVLLGSKWIANKWIYSRFQTFIKPCKLDESN
jgi:prolyl 4-hydroxylase